MRKFSQKLSDLLGKQESITLKKLIDNFAEKNFAIMLLLLLAIPALPLPTGGLTHIFELIAMILELELILGRKTIWLPDSWLNKNLPRSLQTTALPKFVSIIRRIENHSRPRLSKIQRSSHYTRVIGIVLFVFTAFAFLAPPFSGLDTLPALGVVLLSLGMIFEDSALAFMGFIIGCAGIGLIFAIGSVVFKLL